MNLFVWFDDHGVKRQSRVHGWVSHKKKVHAILSVGSKVIHVPISEISPDPKKKSKRKAKDA